MENSIFKLLFDDNIVVKSDSYKLVHWRQYRVGTSKIVSYLEARLGAIYPTTIAVGFQPYLTMLEGVVLSKAKIEAADWFATQHFGTNRLFNKEGWLALLRKHGGTLPIKIKAVKEGTEVAAGNVLMVIENNDPDFPWLTNFLETLLMKVWYPITIATNSFYCRKAIVESLQRTSGNTAHATYALHDFGYRGVSSEETAGLGGMAHLTSFLGTDNIKGIVTANKYYNSAVKNMTEENFKEIFKVYGHSIAASEHSTATPFGSGEGELEYIKHMLDIYPDLPFSFVVDSYDALKMPEKLASFAKIIDQRDSKVVFRLDSGNPVDMILKTLSSLWKLFGGEYINGYKLVNTKIGTLQGDGIDYTSLKQILEAMEANGWATDNLVFGSGGGLLQKFNRDTQRFAIKCCKTIYNDKSIDVRKNPSSDPSKASKSGDLKLLRMSSGTSKKATFTTISSSDIIESIFNSYEDELIPVFENGKLLKFWEFEEVRDEINKWI